MSRTSSGRLVSWGNDIRFTYGSGKLARTSPCRKPAGDCFLTLGHFYYSGMDCRHSIMPGLAIRAGAMATALACDVHPRVVGQGAAR